MEILITKENKQDIERLNSMMKSCYCYGGAERNDYNFERYILPFEKILGKVLFSVSYTAILTELKEKYTIEVNTYTDAEGCQYNSLKKI
jgi:hypothetical protein